MTRARTAGLALALLAVASAGVALRSLRSPTPAAPALPIVPPPPELSEYCPIEAGHVWDYAVTASPDLPGAPPWVRVSSLSPGVVGGVSVFPRERKDGHGVSVRNVLVEGDGLALVDPAGKASPRTFLRVKDSAPWRAPFAPLFGDRTPITVELAVTDRRAVVLAPCGRIDGCLEVRGAGTGPAGKLEVTDWYAPSLGWVKGTIQQVAGDRTTFVTHALVRHSAPGEKVAPFTLTPLPPPK